MTDLLFGLDTFGDVPEGDNGELLSYGAAIRQVVDEAVLADEIGVYGGVVVSAALIRRSEDFPLDLNWVLGAGLGIGDAVLIAFPIGVSLGRDVEAEGVWFNPYVAPRVVVDAWLGSAVENEMNLGLAVDLGLDISFDPGWAIRFGASLGEREALAIGFSFRLR
jgi:hypothetical protein